MDESVIKALVRAIEEGLTPSDAVQAALKADPAAFDQLSPLLTVAIMEPTAVEAVRVGTGLAPGGGDHRSGALEAWRGVFTAARGARRWPAAAEALRPMMPRERSEVWPLVVSHPLGLLYDALCEADQPAHPRWAAAYLELRDTAEGIARLLWAVTVHDVLTLIDRIDALAVLAERPRPAVVDVLSTLGRGFTLGTVSWLAGTRRVWAALGDVAQEHDLPQLHWLAEHHRSWGRPIARITAWRNEDLGHGMIGCEVAPREPVHARRAHRSPSVPGIAGLDRGARALAGGRTAPVWPLARDGRAAVDRTRAPDCSCGLSRRG